MSTPERLKLCYPHKLSLSSDKRALSGRLIPWEGWAGGHDFTLAFAENSLDKSLNGEFPVPLYVGHDYEGTNLPLAKLNSYEKDADGINIDFKFPDTQIAQDAMTLVEDGALIGFSAGIVVRKYETMKKDFRRVESGILDHIALVPNPSFQESQEMVLLTAMINRPVKKEPVEVKFDEKEWTANFNIKDIDKEVTQNVI